MDINLTKLLLFPVLGHLLFGTVISQIRGYYLPPDYAASFHPPTTVECPSGYRAVFEQCYRLVDDPPLPFAEEAQERCESYNGTLAEAKDDLTNGAIYNFTELVGTTNGTIIGARCKRKGCKKVVTFGYERVLEYRAWAFSEPSGQPLQLCIITNYRSRPGAWNNVNCNCENAAYPCRFQAVCQTNDSCPRVTFSEDGLTFEETTGDEVAESLERCNDAPDSPPKATRRCVRHGNAAFWDPYSSIEYSACEEQNTEASTEGSAINIHEPAEVLDLPEEAITSENVRRVSRMLVNITDVINSTKQEQLDNKLESIVAQNESTADGVFQVTGDIVRIIDKLADKSTTAGEHKTEDTGSFRVTPKYVNLLERQVTKLQRNGSNFTLDANNFRVKGVHLQTDEFEHPLTFSVSKEFPSTITGEKEVNITFPEGLMRRFTKGGLVESETVALTVIDYSNTIFFRNEESSQGVLASTVIGVNFEGVDVKNLSSDMPIIVEFPLQTAYSVGTRERCSPDLSYTCSYWDFSLSNGSGDWSSDGCQTVDVNENVVTCHCFHLTNLSVLVHESTNITLQLISKIGCALSMIGLAITIVFLLLSKKVRSKESMQIQLRLCLAFLCFYGAFLGGIERKPFPCERQLEEILCTGSAALIHYFALSTMAWMCVEALHMYMLFVRATGARIPNFFLLARIFGWGFPAALVVASLGKWYSDYTAESYCFLAWKGPLKFILLPFQGLMFTFNFVCYILVALRLICSKEMGSTKSAWQIASRRVRNAVAIACLLGMSWAFGFISLVYVDDSGKIDSVNIFDILFCVTLSMNGIVIFVLFCLRRDEFWEPVKRVMSTRNSQISGRKIERDFITNDNLTTAYNKSTVHDSSGNSSSSV